MSSAPMVDGRGGWFTGADTTATNSNQKFWAILTGYDGSRYYSWVRQGASPANPAAPLIDQPGYLSGTEQVFPAYEVNGVVVPPGTYVELSRGYWDPAPASGSSVAKGWVFFFSCPYYSPQLSEVSIYNAGVFVAKEPGISFAVGSNLSLTVTDVPGVYVTVAIAWTGTTAYVNPPITITSNTTWYVSSGQTLTISGGIVNFSSNLYVSGALGYGYSSFSIGTGNTNNKTITTAVVQRITATAAGAVLTGIVPNITSGVCEFHELLNVGTYNFTIAHASVSSSAGNRFLLPAQADTVLPAGAKCTIVYDPVDDYWSVGDMWYSTGGTPSTGTSVLATNQSVGLAWASFLSVSLPGAGTYSITVTVLVESTTVIGDSITLRLYDSTNSIAGTLFLTWNSPAVSGTIDNQLSGTFLWSAGGAITLNIQAQAAGSNMTYTISAGGYTWMNYVED